MKQRMFSVGMTALAIGMISASGAPTSALAFANPTRLADPDPNTNDAGLLDIQFDSGMNVYGAGGDQGHIGSYLEVNSDFGGAPASINRGLGDYDTGGAGGHISGTPATTMSIAAVDDTDDPTLVGADVSLN